MIITVKCAICNWSNKSYDTFLKNANAFRDLYFLNLYWIDSILFGKEFILVWSYMISLCNENKVEKMIFI